MSKLPIILFKWKWIFCNKNIYICVCVCVCVLIVNIKFGDFVRNERNSVWKGLIILFW